MRADTSSVTVADPLSADWQLPAGSAGDPLATAAPRHLAAVPEPVPAAVFAALADLLPAPRAEVPAAAPEAAVDVDVEVVPVPAPALPAPRVEMDDYELRNLVLAELRALAQD